MNDGTNEQAIEQFCMQVNKWTNKRIKGICRTRAKEAHTAWALPGFRSMKQLRVLLLPPGWDASPSQGYPQQYFAGTYLYTWVERDNVGQGFLSKETTRWQGLGIEPPTFSPNAPTTTPPHPHLGNKGDI